MQDAHLSDGAYLMVTLGPDKKLGVMRRQSIPIGAVASTAEQLGYDDVIDAAQAVSMIARRKDREYTSEGEHFLSEVFQVLAYREEVREAEAIRAKQEGTRDDPRSPALRGALAARRALLDLTGAHTDSESLLAKCQQRARQQIGLPEPSKPPSIVRGAFTCGDGSCGNDVRGYFNQSDREKLRQLLEPKLDKLRKRRAEFCHGLTSNEANPLEEDTPPEQPPSLEDITARYTERQDHAA